MKLSRLLLAAASLLCVAPLTAAPPPVTASTMSVVVGEEQTIVFPADRLLPQTFTAATRATTAPVMVGQLGWETDSGVLYIASGTSAGNWNAYTLSFASISSKPTTRAGYGITDAQALDSDLTSIAALSTTPYGRSLLTQTNAAALRTTAGLELGVNVQNWDADLDDLANTSPGNSKYYGTNGSGTKGFYDLPEGGGGGGSVTHPGDEVAYVYPNTGNNVTGDGTQAAPYASIQKAIEAGKTIILLGEGNAGGIDLTGAADFDLDVTIKGLGNRVSSIGALSANGNNLTVRDGGMWTFVVEGTLTSGSQSSTEDSGSINLYKVDATGQNVLSTGANGANTGDPGRNAGDIYMEYCNAASLDTLGGSGATGDTCTAGGMGGNGASVTIRHCNISGFINSGSGSGGADGGAGTGPPGSPGPMATIEWSTIQAGPNGFSGWSIVASLVAGTWDD